MDKLQKIKITFRESERWFRAIFNQTFGFIRLMQLMGIFVEGNQTALKIGGITSSEVIRCPLGEACWSDFSQDLENLSPDRREVFNSTPTLIEKLVQGLGLTTRASRWLGTYGSEVKPFSNQSQKVIFLIPKTLQELGFLSQVNEKVLVFFRTVEGCDRQQNTNTGMAQVWRSLRKFWKFQEVGLVQIHKMV
ncbi:PAS domain S-box protein [Nostoc sp. CHAB 5834]|nr:PAS domain S-box protein [Nostoc sp. CHAB 5834]